MSRAERERKKDAYDLCEDANLVPGDSQPAWRQPVFLEIASLSGAGPSACSFPLLLLQSCDASTHLLLPGHGRGPDPVRLHDALRRRLPLGRGPIRAPGPRRPPGWGAPRPRLGAQRAPKSGRVSHAPADRALGNSSSGAWARASRSKLMEECWHSLRPFEPSARVALSLQVGAQNCLTPLGAAWKPPSLSLMDPRNVSSVKESIPMLAPCISFHLIHPIQHRCIRAVPFPGPPPSPPDQRGRLLPRPEEARRDLNHGLKSGAPVSLVQMFRLGIQL